MPQRLAAIAVVLLFTGALRAAEPPAPRIACVDLVRVLEQSDRAREFEAKFTQERQLALRRNQTFIDEIERLKAEIEKLPMGTPERLKLQSQHQTLLKEGTEHARNRLQELDAMVADNLRQVYAEMTSVVEALAREGGYDLVLQDQRRAVDGKRREEVFAQVAGRVVLFARDGYDLTDAVVKRMNAAYAGTKQPATAADVALPSSEKRTK